MAWRVSVRKILLCVVAASLFCVVIYHINVHMDTGSVRTPREQALLGHTRQERSHKENIHRKALSKTTSAVHLTTAPKSNCNDSMCIPTLPSTHDLPKLSEQEDHLESRTPERCAISQQTFKHLQKFVFFIGYPRSGHSIVASFMDAHPYMLVAHEFSLFTWWPQYAQEHRGADLLSSESRLTLLNSLVNSSYWESQEGERSCKYKNKGYTLCTKSPWHGKCDGYLQVIGDKRAGGTCDQYINSSAKFERNYRDLIQLVNLPIKVVHVVRNPYDLIATSTLYEAARLKNGGIASGDNANYVQRIKRRVKMSDYQLKYRNNFVLRERVRATMQLAEAVTNMKTLFGSKNVLELHNCDLANDPDGFVRKICEFFEVECSSEYVRTCVEKAYSNVSKSREYVHWPQEVIETVERERQRFSFFRRYSFDGAC